MSIRSSKQPQSSAPLHSSPMEPLDPSDASYPVLPVFHPLVGDGSEPAPVPNPGVSISSPGDPTCSAVAAAVYPFSLASFQYIPDCSHHRCGTRVPCCRSATSHNPRIGQVAMNCVTVLCLRGTNVLALTTPASLRTHARGGVGPLSVPPTAWHLSCQTPCYPALEGVQGRLHTLGEDP